MFEQLGEKIASIPTLKYALTGNPGNPKELASMAFAIQYGLHP